MKFKYLTKEQFDALTGDQQAYYLEQKKAHEDAEQKAAIDTAVKTAIDEATTELKGTIDEQKTTIGGLTVKLDEADQKLERELATINRVKAFAKDNERKGKFFDEALNEALEQKENQEGLEELKSNKNAKVTLQLKAVGTMGISSIADISMANAEMRPGIIMLPNRRIHMRDIMNTGRMTTSDFHYLREVGGEGDVNNWTENSGVKPALDLDYIEKTASSQYIAGVLDISRKSLDDIPALRSALAPRLLEKYLIKEDQQILQGTGTGNQLEGILEVAEPYDGNKIRLIERVIDAIGQLEENEFYADGVIIKPRDWAEIATTISQGTEQVFTLPGLGIVSMNGGVLYINGVPVYKMNGMPGDPDRQFLVGDWMMGAQLLIREDPRVEFSYENADNFKQNKVTVRVEGRVALPIYFDNAFVKGDTFATT